jgi:hypothetical protein
VGSLHWLIVVPFYFFGALALLSGLVVLTRILRLPVGINAIVITSIGVSLLGVALPLWLDWIDLDALTGFRAAGLLIATFVFAGVDAVLKDRLPLPLDADLEIDE